MEWISNALIPRELSGVKLTFRCWCNVKALAAPYGIDVLVRASRMLLDSLPDLPLRVVSTGTVHCVWSWSTS